MHALSIQLKLLSDVIPEHMYIQVVVALLPFLLQPVCHDNPSGKASMKPLGPLVVTVYCWHIQSLMESALAVLLCSNEVALIAVDRSMSGLCHDWLMARICLYGYWRIRQVHMYEFLPLLYTWYAFKFEVTDDANVCVFTGECIYSKMHM